ncbi:hypothetical protein [Thermococcus stetteri]|uniref:hypothetical protein n=1 Tax=Thermococcus stetteri TaxID=49900 RepID=UPI001AE4C1A2|nr:hypothetical protein [Thermococcus stetteri]MBP1912922.1 hypothetical protein [Thermococcus stetteri]
MNQEEEQEESANKVLAEIPWLAGDYQGYLRRILEEKGRERKEVLKYLRELNTGVRRLLPKELADVVPFGDLLDEE